MRTRRGPDRYSRAATPPVAVRAPVVLVAVTPSVGPYPRPFTELLLDRRLTFAYKLNGTSEPWQPARRISARSTTSTHTSEG